MFCVQMGAVLSWGITGLGLVHGGFQLAYLKEGWDFFFFLRNIFCYLLFFVF